MIRNSPKSKLGPILITMLWPIANIYQFNFFFSCETAKATKPPISATLLQLTTPHNPAPLLKHQQQRDGNKHQLKISAQYQCVKKLLTNADTDANANIYSKEQVLELPKTLHVRPLKNYGGV